MKFYTSVGPNPRVVKMFAVERGIDLPSETVDLSGGATKCRCVGLRGFLKIEN